jgi:simple sugar transport system substrate-binding protein
MRGRSRDSATAVAASLPRRAVMRGVAAGPVAALLAGAAGGARAADEAAFPPHPRWKFVFVNHVTANPFFVPCQYGIQDACALLGCDYQWTGSETSDVAQMVNTMNTAIAGKADAIAVCLVDPKGFDRPVENALAAGIRSSATTPIPRPTSASPIGQDLFLSGQIMGERIVKLVGSGKVSQLGVADWTRGGQTVRVRREITVSLPVAVCRDEIRAKLVEPIAEIRGDYRSTIALEPLVH